MYLYKTFKNSEFEILSGFTRTYWTLGMQIHWNLITRRNTPELNENLFAFDIHILCFQFSFNYWWEPSSLASK